MAIEKHALILEIGRLTRERAFKRLTDDRPR